MQNTYSLQYATSLSNFAKRAIQTTRQLDPSNDLDYVRISSRQFNIMMATLEFGTVVVMQKPLKYEEKDTVQGTGYNYPQNIS